MLENRWRSRLSSTDKFVLNYIMGARLEHYGYGHYKTRVLGFILTPLLILFPLSYERRFWSLSYIRNRVRNGQTRTIAANGINYLRRVRTFLKFYLMAAARQPFNEPLLASNPEQSKTAMPLETTR